MHEAVEPRGRGAVRAVRRIIDQVCNGSVEGRLVGIAGSNMNGRKSLRKIVKNNVENDNVRKLAIVVSACLLLAPLNATIANAQNMRSEAADHPRIAQAIHDLEDAIAYMEAAPNNFGGHKAAALDASRAAIRELRASLAFRADQDRRF
jgi:hypothetical protein